MPSKVMTSKLTTTGDTTKTLIEELTIPGGVSKIAGVSVYALAGGALTTAEPITGIFELESRDIQNINPHQFPLDPVILLGAAGALSLRPTIHPVNIPVKQGEKISGYVTFDMAMTVNYGARYTLYME